MSDEANQPDDLGPLAAASSTSPAEAAADLPPSMGASDAAPKRRLPLTVIGAAAAAGLIGVTVGLALAPGVRTPAPTTPASDQMQVMVETKPDPAPAVGPPMPTLQGLPAAAPSIAPPPAAPPLAARPAPPPPAAAAPALAVEDRADRACAYAAADPASGCGDPALIEADRELYAAYQAARRAGVPARELRDDQEDWRVTAAAAADESRAALLDAYRGRVDQVWAMVEQWDRRGWNARGADRPRFR